MFKKLLNRSDFYKNVVTVFSGTILSQVITVVITPLLAKWFYGPEDFGIYATFVATTSILSNLATGKFEMAIMLPDSDKRAYNLVRLSLYCAAIICLFLLGVIVLFHNVFLKFLNSPQLSIWLYFVPLAVMFMVYNQVISYWYIRLKDFKRLSLNRITKAGSNAVANVAIGLLPKKTGGLVIGNIIGNAFASLLMFIRVRRSDVAAYPYNSKLLSMLFKKYKHFPQFVLPSELLNTLAAQMPIFILVRFFGNATVGAFSFVIALLGVPITLLSSAILDVFKEKANQDYRTLGNCRDIYVKTFKHLVLLSLPVFLLFYFLAPYAFTMFFGNKWAKAGTFAQILAVMYFFKFISSPLSYTFIVAQRMREDFFWHIYIVISLFLGLYLGAYFIKDDVVVLWIYAINFSVIYSIYLMRSYSFSKGTAKKMMYDAA